MIFLKYFFSNFCSHIKDPKWVFLSIVQDVTETLNKYHFSLLMGNCPKPIAEHSGQNLLESFEFCLTLYEIAQPSPH